MRKKTSRSRESVKSPSPLTAPAEAANGPRGVVVAVELGAEYPSLLPEGGGPRRVLTQLEGESPAAFAQRITSSLDGAFGRGVALGQLSLACNERLDDAAQLARRSLAGAALGSMAKEHAGKVCLSASARSSARLRQGLTTLARGLFDEWRTAGLEATVDFGTEAPVSGAASALSHTARVA
jgi:hypothetical protein